MIITVPHSKPGIIVYGVIKFSLNTPRIEWTMCKNSAEVHAIVIRESENQRQSTLGMIAITVAKADDAMVMIELNQIAGNIATGGLELAKMLEHQLTNIAARMIAEYNAPRCN